MPSPLDTWLRRTLANAGLSVVRAKPISRSGSAAAFKIDLSDGRAVKLRVFSRDADAADIWRFLQQVRHGALPRPLLLSGRVLVVEYVAGKTVGLKSRNTSIVRRAAALMARLHATPLPPRDRAHPTLLPPDSLKRVTASLVRRRLIDRASARTLSALPLPRWAPLALTHGDLCPENLVMTAAGKLRAIDEERLAVRPAAFDLARTITRWPLSPTLERAFLAGYAREGGRTDDFVAHRSLWLATALGVSARYRMQKRLPGVRRIAAALKAISRRAADRSGAG